MPSVRNRTRGMFAVQTNVLTPVPVSRVRRGRSVRPVSVSTVRRGPRTVSVCLRRGGGGGGADGAGGCLDACRPNRCASSVPNCSRTGNGTTYSCSCTSSSCGVGKQCSGGICVSCAANTVCTCPSGQVANGGGSCVTPVCSSDEGCLVGKYCLNAGKLNASCVNCGVNSVCTCPSGYVANGSGSCVKPVCTDNTTCGAGRQCIDPGKYNGV